MHVPVHVPCRCRCRPAWPPVGIPGAREVVDPAMTDQAADAPVRVRIPTILRPLTGGAKERLDAIIPARHAARIHLTMTDDHPFAMAVVIIEALPEDQ